MIILDSNIISAFMKEPDAHLKHWLNLQPLESMWTTSICVYEINYGLKTLPKGKRRSGLEEQFRKVLELDLNNRVLDFDSNSAQQAATIASNLRQLGRSGDIRDTMIAGIVAARRAVLATLNVRHFDHTGISIVNPWI